MLRLVVSVMQTTTDMMKMYRASSGVYLLIRVQAWQVRICSVFLPSSDSVITIRMRIVERAGCGATIHDYLISTTT